MNEILVFGHKNPDTDTIASAYAAAYLLNQLDNKNTKAVALGKVNEETKYALDYFGMDAPEIIEKASSENVVLVDHNEELQSVSNIKDVNIEYIYDHHKIDFRSNKPLYFNNKPYGSASTILYYEFKMNNIIIPKKIAGLMLSAIISDTLLLKSPTTSKMDKPALENLAEIAGIKDYTKYGLEMLKAGTNLKNKSIQDIINGDAKSFEMNNKIIRICQVNSISIEDVFKKQKEISEKMIKENSENGYDTFLLLVTNILESNSELLIIGNNKKEIEKAFNKEIINDRIYLPGVVSRKKQIVPPLKENI